MFTIADLNKDYHYGPASGPQSGSDMLLDQEIDDFLERENAVEMVAFINHILKTWKWSKPFPVAKQLGTGKKIERLIREHLPGRMRSKEKQIEPWLRSNWNNY